MQTIPNGAPVIDRLLDDLDDRRSDEHMERCTSLAKQIAALPTFNIENIIFELLLENDFTMKDYMERALLMQRKLYSLE